MDIYLDCKQSAQKYEEVWHYTTIEALEKIVANQSFRLSRLDLVNDKYENERLDDILKNQLYVLCFTHDCEESQMFWEDYAQKEKGVLLKFENKYFTENIEIYGDEQCKNRLSKYIKSNTEHKTNNTYNDWTIRNIDYLDIYYDDNEYIKEDQELKEFFKDATMLNGENFKYKTACGVLKSKSWEQEKETRYRVKVQYKGTSLDIKNREYIKPKFNYLYMHINDEIFRTMKVVLNPWSDDDFQRKVKEILSSNLVTKHCTIERSKLHINL